MSVINPGFTSQLLMVRPAHFGFNFETSANNVFQTEPTIAESAIATAAQQEFDAFVELIRAHNIEVEVWEDDAEHVKPDAVFPNNWVSFHIDGTIITYPMFAENRRKERSNLLLESIRKKYGFKNRIEMEDFERLEQYLEGTGSMVLDRENRVCYACISARTHHDLVEKWCALMDYTPITFDALDQNGTAIYHTNVMMAIGQDVVVICKDAISDPEEWRQVEESLVSTDKQIIEISFNQMSAYAGNMLFVNDIHNKAHVVVSQTAWDSLNDRQQVTLRAHAQIISGQINTIETVGGGSVRCMLAEIFVPTN